MRELSDIYSYEMKSWDTKFNLEKSKESVSRGAERTEVCEYPRSYKDDVANFSSGASILLEAGVVGDLVLTCYSLGSRNTKFGYELGISSDKRNFYKNIRN